MRWLPLVLLAPFPAFAGRAPGEVIDPAVVVDITPEGLNALDQLVGGLVPSSIPIPTIAQGDAAPEDCIDLIFDEICWTPWRYALSVTGFDAGIAIDDLAFELAQDEIRVTAVVTVNVSSEADPGEVYFKAEAADVNLFGLEFTVIDIEDTCRIHLPPTPLQVETAITLSLDWPTPDEPVVTVDVAPVQLAFDLSALEIRDCFLGDLLDFVDAVNDFIGSIFSFDIYQLLLDQVTPLLDDAVQGLLGDLQGTIQGLFTDLVIEQELDLLGATLGIKLAPDDLVVTPDGIRFSLEGAIGGPGLPAACVAEYGITESLATGAGVPAIGVGPAGVTHALGAMVDDDLVNQALFAIWYQGVLCFAIDSSGGLPIDLPIPLDTSLLGLLGARDFEVFFPVAKPIALVTRPAQPPVATLGSAGDLRITAEQLGLDLYAELDGRMARMVGLELGLDIGAGLDLDGTTGQLGIAIDIGEEALSAKAIFNELAPSANESIASGLEGLVGTLVGQLLPGLLGDLGFALPTFGTVGISDLRIAGSGPDGDWLGLFGTIGPVPYENGDLLEGGCSGEGGCAGGCEGGCEGGGCTQGGPTPLVWALPILLVLRRRSRRAGA